MKKFNWMLHVVYPAFVLVVGNFGVGATGMFLSTNEYCVAITILFICCALIVVAYFVIKKTFVDK